MIERRDERQREKPQRHRGGQREQEREPQAPIEELRILLVIRFAVMLRKRRQQHGAERDAQQRARKFHQAIRVGDPRNRAVAEQGGELRVDERGDLRGRDADDRRSHRAEHAAHARIGECNDRPRQHAKLDERAQLERELCNAAGEYAPGERDDRRIDVRREIERSGDDRQVEQHRRDRGNREATIDVQHAAGERCERNEQDVGKDDADHRRGQIHLSGRLRESARQQIDEPWRREHADDRHGEENDRQNRSNFADKILRRLPPLLAVILGENRHERLRKRALGEQAAQQIRQPKRRLERVHLEARAERRRLETFANEPGDAGEKRHPADGRQGSKKIQVSWMRAGDDNGLTSPKHCCRTKNRVLCAVFRVARKWARGIDYKERNSMANTAQARKRAKQAEETRKRNASMKSALRTAVKNVKKAIAAGDKATAAKTMQVSQAIVDRIADKKIVHKNLASRTKSRLVQAIKAMA